jgi:hypothetical protein
MPNNAPHNALRMAVDRAISEGSPIIVESNSLDKPASWIIREIATGAVMCETWNPWLVEHLNTDKYEAVPILEYLGALNKDQS